MLYWEPLCELLAVARQEGVSPHFVETNCSFASTDTVARERLEILRDLGVRGLLLSADPYHQAHVPPGHAIRVRRIAREVFGGRNVWAPDVPDARIREHAEIAADPERLRTHVRARPPILVGSAYRELRGMLPDYPLAELPIAGGWGVPHTAHACPTEFDAGTIWEIHVDPYNNIQTNCGVILGDAGEVSVQTVMDAGPAEANWVARALATSGPLGLAELARREHGYRLPARAQSKCSLCYEVRSFLRPHCPELLGPDELYS